jgi:putative exosortase-associated protein (TIGR04073 family)
MFITLALGILVAMMLPPTVAAQEGGDTASKIGLKAFRGVSNTVLGLVTEIPRTMYYDSRTDGPTYGLTVGFLEGIALGLGRTAVGVFELVTFPIPFPRDYEPILNPGDPFGEGKSGWAK